MYYYFTLINKYNINICMAVKINSVDYILYFSDTNQSMFNILVLIKNKTGN